MILDTQAEMFGTPADKKVFQQLKPLIAELFNGEQLVTDIAAAICNFNSKFGGVVKLKRSETPHELGLQDEQINAALRKMLSRPKLKAQLDLKVENATGNRDLLDTVANAILGQDSCKGFTEHQVKEGRAMMLTVFIEAIVNRHSISIFKVDDLVDTFIKFSDLDPSFDTKKRVFRHLLEKT